ncbi:Eco57I restriction-modification methylase domain-containing protein [Microbacterium sp. bgisy189]|uniref:Eco57I restriction-modification methylase domain-containing protein n=1 Tax=Microbacterium sp. bgisy189 TaxID=3413798 RepID=UPI003EBB86EB
MTGGAAVQLTGARTIPWTTKLPEGLTPVEVVFGQDDTGDVGEVQVAVATATARPTKALMDAAWKTRGANTAMPVLVVAVQGESAWVYPGSGDVLGPAPVGSATRQLQSVLDEPNVMAAQVRLNTVERALSSGEAVGFSNQFLFASYHLRVNVPRRADWAASQAAAEPMLSKQGKELISALGFTADPVSNASGSALVLRAASGSRRAIAVLLDESENFDQKSPAYQLSPVAHGLELAGREEVPWLVVMRQSTLRLYPGRDGVGVGQRGQSETYFELDLALLDPTFSALLPLIFSADALEKGGSADQILDGSGRYAAELGANLRDRVYEGVVPALSIAIAQRLPQLGLRIDADGLKVAYALTLRILFRILFQAYGEDSELLPAGRNPNYDANSLQKFVKENLDTDAGEFGSSSSVWLDLVQVWDAIFNGNKQWEVPAYGGSLFDPATEEGELLTKLSLPDSVLGPALQAMLTEVTEDGTRGPVDFRSLQVREFGTIYEGLLESSLSLAEVNLTVDAKGAFVPAKEGDAISALAGTPYFHSASGERKATGSYFTPKIVVDHLIERSVEPALGAHLQKVKVLVEEGKEREAANLFWDFRVADLAMGSAHFLVAAVDKIERGMRDFLTVTDMPRVRAELARLADKAREALGDDVEAAGAITEAQLLRRQVARRCIYGLDINPLAVELSRLALWIHTFVPGLPMSSLDHGLVLGNSLTGIGTIEEALDALDPKRAPGQGTFFDDVILDELARAKTRLADFAAASEADKSEVEAGAKLLAEAKEASETVRRIFDAAVAVRIGDVPAQAILTTDDLDDLVSNPAVADTATRLSPAHMPYLFPEVFLRDNAGFDVLVGNPPWEEVMVEEPKFWLRVRPGLLGLKPAELKAEIARLRVDRADLLAELQREVDAVDALRKVLLSGPYPGLGTGDVDLYQAFAWRFWQLLRDGGVLALVTPRSLMNAAGNGRWRAAVMPRAITEVVTLTNSGNWVFENVDGRYSFALSAIQRAERTGGIIRMAGPFYSESEFIGQRDGLGELTFEALTAASGTAALPNLPDPASVEVFAQLRTSPRLDSRRTGWDFRPVAEFHATNDRSTFDDGEFAPGKLPVRGGAGFDLWTPETTEVYAWSAPATVEAALQAKRQRQVGLKSSAFFGKGSTWSSDPATLPFRSPRIAFRDVTNATNTRTSIAALVPPNTLLTNAAPYVFRYDGDARAEAYLLAVLSTVPLDWYARKYVELHMNLHIFNALPVPSRPDGSLWARRVVEIAGRLAAVDERYRTWANEVGVEVGTANDAPTRSDLIAELDALVSLLYGLTEDQVKHIFKTFHRGWDYQPRLDAVLAHYAAWKDR